jgi:hypothetical protein
MFDAGWVVGFQAPEPPPGEAGFPPGPFLPNPEEHEPFWDGLSIIELAAIDPVSEDLPSAVTHRPTARAFALAAAVRVYVVAAVVCTIRTVGAVAVDVAFLGSGLSTVKLAPLTAVTLPKAPNPANPLRPAPGPPVRLGLGAPGGRAPGGRWPPNAEHPPFTADEISTVAAWIGPVFAPGTAVAVDPPVPEAGLALRACTQAPTTTLDRVAATVSVKVVVGE